MSSTVWDGRRERRLRLALDVLEPRLLLSVADFFDDLPGLVGFDADTTAYESIGDATPTGESYMLTDEWGGAWSDAEKTVSNTEDDLMCWAAAASNVLAWTAWGLVAGLSTGDDIFAYFQDHWTDQGGLMEYGWDWWWDGTNAAQGWGGWSQVDVPGASFYAGLSFDDYYHWQGSDDLALEAIDEYLRAGDGVTLAVYGPGGHAITAWGFNYDPAAPDYYLGVWVTDSDDSKGSDTPPDLLRYYEVDLLYGRWYLQGFYGSNSWYIGEVQALEQMPGFGAPPVLGGLPDLETDEDVPLPDAVDLWAYASDPDTPDSALSFSVLSSSDPDAGVTISSSRWLSVNPAANWYGISTVTVLVSDGVLTDSDAFDVTVNAVEDPPSITMAEPGSGSGVAVGDTITVRWTDSDPDDNAVVDLYWDTDADPANNLPAAEGTDWGAIALGISEDDPADSVAWTVDLPAGASFYLYGVISDGKATATDYTDYAVDVALARWESGGVAVSLYDVAGGVDVAPADITVTFGKDATVSSIKLGGYGSMAGVGIVVTGASYVGSVKDARRGPLGDLAFIVTDCPIGTVSLKSGLTGYDMNGRSLGGLLLPDDADGDGLTGDPTAVWTDGTINAVQLAGPLGGDIWAGGGGVSLGKLVVKQGGQEGDLRAAGSISKVKVNGDLAGEISAEGTINSLVVTGRLLAGANVSCGGLLNTLRLGGYDTDNGGTPFGVTAGAAGVWHLGAVRRDETSLPFAYGDFLATTGG